jgi:site-specific recombinase XerD
VSNHLLTLKWVEEHIAWQKEVRRLAAGSWQSYEKILTLYAHHVNGKALDAVDPSEVEQFVQRPRVRRGHGRVGAPATVGKDRAVISGFYSWLIARGELAVNPAKLSGRAKVTTRQPRPVPDHLFQAVWTAALPLERVWLGLGGFVGLRRAEIVALRADQILIANRTIVSFMRKGGSDDTLSYGEIIDLVHDKMPHLLPDPEQFLEPLHLLASRRVGRILLPFDYRTISERQAEKHGLPLGSVDPQVLNRALRPLLKRAGLPDSAFTPHALRHTTATNLLRMGVPPHIVQSLLAHSDIQTTMRYVKVSGGALAEWRRANSTLGG